MTEEKITHILGRFSDNEGVTQIYDDGDHCDGPMINRKATVYLYCDKSKSKVVQVYEPTTCSYNINIVDPRACENDSFPLSTDIVKRVGTEASSSEEWLLELDTV